MSAPPRPLSLVRATLTIAAKEVVASFRDRQTTLYTVVLPIVLYPLLFWCLIQSALFVQGRREQTEVRVGLGAPARTLVPPGLVHALREPPISSGAAAAPVGPERQRELQRVNRLSVGPLRQPLDEQGARDWLTHGAPGELAEERPAAVLVVPPAALHDADALPPEGSTEVEGTTLVFDSTDSASKLAKERVEGRVPRYAHDVRVQQLPTGTAPAELEPFGLPVAHDVAAGDTRGAHILALILPMLLVIMTVMGAFFPAVDLTAGERERNTAETTLLLPVPRLAVQQGKILAVCSCAIVATALNLFALALSAGHLLHLWSREEAIVISVPLVSFAAVAPLALLFAFFVSAALTGIASLTRTFKEGQALLGPVQLLFIVPAMVGAIPGLSITPGLALVPIVNVVLVFRALIDGEARPLEYTLTAVSLLVYALLAVALAVRLLSREPLFDAERAGRTSWFARLRGGRA